MTYTPEQLREDGHFGTREEMIARYKELKESHADALEELAKMREAVELLYDKWESGEDCHEVDGEDMGAFLGKAFRLSEEEEDAILALLKGVPTPAPMRIVMQRAERAEAALAECRARLEIDFATDGNGKRVPVPSGAPDGIACRDETIRLLEAALAESERKIERLKFHVEAMAKAHALSNYDYKGAFAAYRAEFKESTP